MHLAVVVARVAVEHRQQLVPLAGPETAVLAR
jgi:hypothetical protein